VLEQESTLGAHQSGHNSGVLHAGLYYAPGSQKARLCRDGKAELETFLEGHAIPFERCGKVIVATGGNEPAHIVSALEQLGENGVSSILLEGGPKLAGSFLDAGEVDEMRLFVAPMVLAGRTARDPLEGDGVEAVADARRALSLSCEPSGDDVLLTARFEEW